MNRVEWFVVCSVLSVVSLEANARDGSWRPVGLAGGGGMFSIAGSPHDAELMMLSCDMSGAYLSRDGGRQWTMIHHRQLRGNTRCTPVFHPSKPDVIYAVSGWGGPIRVTTDGGTSWSDFTPRSPWRGRIHGMFLAASGEFFVSTDRGLWHGPESGAAWERSKGVEGIYLGMCADPSRAGRYFIGTDHGVFCSDDGGRSFRSVVRGLPERALTAFAGASGPGSTFLYAATECELRDGQLTGGIHVSTDGGDRWRRVMNPELNVQTERSSQWANGDIPRYLFLRTTDDLPRRVYVYCSGTSYSPPNHSTVYRSDDAGESWRATFFSDPRFKGDYNVEDDRVTLSIGQRYQPVPFSFAVNPRFPDTLMMTTSMTVFVSHDGGRRWQVSQAAGEPRQFGESIAWPANGLVVTTTWNYDIDPFEPRRHYICYTDLGFARSVDAGRTWIWEGHRIPWHNTTYELAFDPDVPGKIWGAFSNTHDIPNGNIISGRHRVIMSGGVGLSLDHGHTWEKLDLPEAPCVSVVLDPASPKAARTLYASLFEKGVYKSIDSGRTWARKSRGLGSSRNLRCCRLVRHRDGALFVLVTAKKLEDGVFESEGVGLYRSRDYGESWRKINRVLPLRWVKDFTVNPRDANHILMGAANVRGFPQGGLYRTNDGGENWTKIVQRGSEHFGATFHPRRPGWIYMTLTEGARESGLYLSLDDGETWESFETLPFSNIQRVHFDSASPDRIIVTTFGGSVLVGPATP